MYAREVEGRELSFGVSGKLIRNVLVMYDRQTESLWSQLLGEAVSGELQGTKLEFLPAWHMPWQQWKSLHPQTLALKKGFGGDRDPYAGYYQSGATGIIGETYQDTRLLGKEFVLGVELDGQAVAYPFRVLSSEPVVNDTVAGQDLLVVFDGTMGASGVAFDRRLADQTLTFSLLGQEPFLITDAETGSTWEALSGRSVDGPLAGQQLARVKSTSSFWFGWKDFHPNTLVYGLDSS